MENRLNSSENFFPILLDNNPPKLLYVIFSILSVITFVPLYSSMIWYQKFGNEHKQTLINQLTAFMGWIIIFFLLFILPGSICIALASPLPGWFCHIQIVLRNTATTALIVTLDFIMLIKYAYIFWLKNPGAVHEDFWNCFLTLWIIGFSFGTQFSFLFWPGVNVTNILTAAFCKQVF